MDFPISATQRLGNQLRLFAALKVSDTCNHSQMYSVGQRGKFLNFWLRKKVNIGNLLFTLAGLTRTVRVQSSTMQSLSSNKMFSSCWLLRWCPANKVGFEDNWLTFLGRPDLIRRDGIYLTLSRAPLKSWNLNKFIKRPKPWQLILQTIRQSTVPHASLHFHYSHSSPKLHRNSVCLH